MNGIPGLSTLLSYFQNERHVRTKEEDEALHALLKAIHETQQYIREGVYDEEKEMELSYLWGEAAIAARKISKDLAERAYIKRGYWQDPDQWSYDAVKEAGIALEDIEEELRRLISK